MSVLETIRVNSSGVAQSLSGYFGSTGQRRARGRGALNGVGATLGMNTATLSSPAQNFRKGIPPGFAGFAGEMTKADIANKHPPGTAQSHIDAMHHYMESGMSFEDAHNKANREGLHNRFTRQELRRWSLPFSVSGLGSATEGPNMREGDVEAEYIFPVLTGWKRAGAITGLGLTGTNHTRSIRSSRIP